MTVPSGRIVAVRRPRNTAPIEDIEREFHTYVTNWRIASKAGAARDKANKKIKEWFAGGIFGQRNVTVNENGSLILEFDVPLEVDGAKILGLENRRTVTPELDLDRVDEWLATLPKAKQTEYRKRLYKQVVTEEFDPDELYALQQSGALTESTLDAMFDNKVSWALCVTKD
jgi:hypothetical protein